MSDAIISAKNIVKVYTGGSVKSVKALDGVGIDIARGSSVCILGTSGAGKSTLLQLLGGLDSPTSGEVMFDGINMYRLSDKDRSRIRNKRIGFVFQFYHLLSEFTAIENVMLPSLIGGRKARDRAAELLKSVGLGDRIRHKPGQLSGGESQRVAIARALINDPEVLLCDEPTGNLDSATSESIYELLFGIKSKSRTTLVVVTHDEDISGRMGSTVRLKDGRVI